MYLYQVRYHRLTPSPRVYRLTVIAANTDEARRAAAIRDPEFSHTVASPRRLGRLIQEPEQADGLTQSKAREFVEWRGTEVEVTDP